MRLSAKKREGPGSDPDGLMLNVGQEITAAESDAQYERIRKNDGELVPTVGRLPSQKQRERVSMDEVKQQQATAAVTAAEAETTTTAAPAEAGKDYSFDRDVWVTGEKFTASMTPESFARFVKELDRQDK